MHALMTLPSRRREPRRIAYVSLGILLAVTLIIAGFFPLLVGALDLLGIESAGEHALHDSAAALFVVTIAVLTLTSLRRPRVRPAHLGAIIISLALYLGIVGSAEPSQLAGDLIIVEILLALAIVVGVLHPARAQVFMPWRAERLERPGHVLLAVLAAVGLAAAMPYAADQYRVQTLHGSDEHTEFQHWASMAAFTVLSPVLLFLAAAGGRGYTGVGVAAAMFAVLLAALFLLRPDAVSAVAARWAALSVAWAFAVLGVLIYTLREPDTLDHDDRVNV